MARDLRQIAIYFQSGAAVGLLCEFIFLWPFIGRIDHKDSPPKDFGNLDANFAANDSSCVHEGCPRYRLVWTGCEGDRNR
jgi:hypothetical protein